MHLFIWNHGASLGLNWFFSFANIALYFSFLSMLGV